MTLMVAAFPLQTSADTIGAEGVAPLDVGGLEQARQAATRDAARQAALSDGAQLEVSGTVSPNGLPLESSRLRPTGSVVGVSPVREWKDGNLLHVAVRAETGQCGVGLEERSRGYRKKVLATRFDVIDVASVSDIRDIWNGIPLELLRRLEGTKKFLPVNVSQSSAFPQIEPVSNRDIIKQLADENGSQFVISGVVLDAGYHAGKWWPDRGARGLEVELLVHDGLTGALIARHREARSIEGNVMVGRDKPFGSVAFYATAFGQAMDSVLAALIRAIQADLECLPFTTRVVRVEGKKIYMAAGATSLIEPGDKLVVYTTTPRWPVPELGSRRIAGIPETPTASLLITQVQPLFSIGELAEGSGKTTVQVGDLVRFEARK